MLLERVLRRPDDRTILRKALFTGRRVIVANARKLEECRKAIRILTETLEQATKEREQLIADTRRHAEDAHRLGVISQRELGQILKVAQ